MKVDKLFLGRQEYGVNLDGKLTMLTESYFDELSSILMYGICKTDVRRQNSIRVISTGGTSAQTRVQLFNSSSRWLE